MDYSIPDFRKPSNARVTDFLERLIPSNTGAGDFLERLTPSNTGAGDFRMFPKPINTGAGDFPENLIQRPDDRQLKYLPVHATT